MKYEKLHKTKSGWSRWVTPRASGYRLACCDCGLVHDVQFRIKDGMMEFRLRRHKAATAAIRRGLEKSS